MSLLSGIIYDYVAPYSFFTAALLFLSSYIYFENKKFKWIGFAILYLISVLLALHLFPGFHNYNIIKNIQLTDNSMNYSLYLNFDKAMAGFIILTFQKDLINSFSQLIKVFKKTAVYGLITITTVLALSYITGYIEFAPKLPWFIGYFILANLFFTCITEELFFRKLIQDNIKKVFFTNRYSASIAIFISGLIFGSFHIAGGMNYFFLAAVSGSFYSLIYESSSKIESSIMIHFILNLTHILLFSYPGLK